MDHHVHLDAWKLGDTVDARKELLAAGDTVAWTGTAKQERFVGDPIVVDIELSRERARRVPGMPIEFESLADQGERIALLEHHVAPGHAWRRRIVPARSIAGGLDQSPVLLQRTVPARSIAGGLDQSPVLLQRTNACAREFGDAGGPAEMIEVAMGQQNVFDIGGRHARFFYAVDNMVDVWLLRRIDQDCAITCLENPGRNKTRPDIIEIVEHLERRNFLVGDIVALAAAIGFAEFLGLWSLGGRGCGWQRCSN